MNRYKIGAPLYILRDHAMNDLFGVLEKLAKIGYEGVEFVGLFGRTPDEIKNKLDSLGLVAIGNHVDTNEFYTNIEKTIDDHKILGCRYITLGWPDSSIKPGMLEFDSIINKYRELCNICHDNGIVPLYHNHNYEFTTNPSLLHVLMDLCKKERLCLEPDLGWMEYCQIEQTDYLIKYRKRSPVIHLKDVYAHDFSKIGPEISHRDLRNNPETGYFEFRPTGYGVVNFAKLLPYCLDCNPEWFVADHDHSYGRDSFYDLKLSYDYIKTLLQIHKMEV